MCHWNLNGIAADKFIKISLLEAYNTIHDFYIICLSETFLDSTYLSDDPRLRLQGYDMIRCDFPRNIKRGGVCMYLRKELPVVRRDDLSTLEQCLVCEIKVKRSKCFITCIYRSPNETEEELNDFCLKFETTCSNIAMENPMGSFILGDFNAKCTNWRPNGINNQCCLLLDDLSNLF